MGLGDIVHDAMNNLLDGLSQYDYFMDYEEDIIELLTAHIKCVVKLDRMRKEQESNKEQDLKNFKITAKKIYDDYITEKELQ